MQRTMVRPASSVLTPCAGPANWSFAAIKRMGYNASKTVLNMMTVQLAWELRDTPVKVNAVCPNCGLRAPMSTVTPSARLWCK